MIRSVLLLWVVITFLTSQISYAHPGRKASDGCHECHTNCSSWGVPWGERHCHDRKPDRFNIGGFDDIDRGQDMDEDPDESYYGFNNQ